MYNFKLTILTQLIILISSTPIYAQNCDELLKDGVFRKYYSSTDQYRQTHIAYELINMSHEDFKKKFDVSSEGGLQAISAFSIAGIMFDASLSSKEFYNRRNELRIRYEFDEIKKYAHTVSEIAADKGLLKTYEKCIESASQPGTVLWKVEKIGPNRFAIRYKLIYAKGFTPRIKNVVDNNISWVRGAKLKATRLVAGTWQSFEFTIDDPRTATNIVIKSDQFDDKRIAIPGIKDLTPKALTTESKKSLIALINENFRANMMDREDFNGFEGTCEINAKFHIASPSVRIELNNTGERVTIHFQIEELYTKNSCVSGDDINQKKKFPCSVTFDIFNHNGFSTISEPRWESKNFPTKEQFMRKFKTSMTGFEFAPEYENESSKVHGQTTELQDENSEARNSTHEGNE